MFDFNKKLGFASVTLFNTCLMLVWGWRGNIYDAKRVFRFDVGSDKGVHLLKAEYVSNYVSTRVYVTRPWRWTWNSEHIARRFGEHVEAGSTGHHPEYWVYNHKLFGQHLCI